MYVLTTGHFKFTEIRLQASSAMVKNSLAIISSTNMVILATFDWNNGIAVLSEYISFKRTVNAKPWRSSENISDLVVEVKLFIVQVGHEDILRVFVARRLFFFFEIRLEIFSLMSRFLCNKSKFWPKLANSAHAGLVPRGANASVCVGQSWPIHSTLTETFWVELSEKTY